jgi:hypothetical protein
MTLIRPRQRLETALFPHNANKKYLIPKRVIDAITILPMVVEVQPNPNDPNFNP